ncbi:MAG: NRDE family protein [Pseudomonadales bacterium]|jgi:uncharacterized protein with NRDE domain|nr:NRDE family protein [Pseudomonadales bacterium]MDP6469502.1 NRDE family protein [Pseudomonadales bacterium]MDP6827344.1 NRDE family protein [Pseudomonadales bacterium]MDP6971166.1 NRDE family protein [Pseudomonadales bacterium]|tara:strand:- start:924 stop:1679 length:756 start_codon:yes stop_codon:yes gene_type:complete
MCLILFAYEPGPTATLVVAANRDEFYARPARRAHIWKDHPGIFAGRDETGGGTWLGVNENGRFAAVTNFTEPGDPEAPCSRGNLTRNFLTSATPASEYAHHLHGPDYAGFNLLLFDNDELVYTSNKGVTRVLGPGFYGLSNAELGAEWPKVIRGIRQLRALCEATPTADALIGLLHDDQVPPDAELPHRGRPLEMERCVAPCFIRGEEYGTRASTAVVFEEGTIRFTEQSYDAGGIPLDRVDTAIQRTQGV